MCDPEKAEGFFAAVCGGVWKSCLGLQGVQKYAGQRLSRLGVLGMAAQACKSVG